MAKILKICWGPWVNASRDKRELSLYRELGHEVLVLAEGGPKDKGIDDVVESFPVKRYSGKPFGPKAPKRLNQLSSWLTWANYARSLGADIISGHDFTGWTIGWLSCVFKKKKPLFIYDSHEFELGRNVKRDRLRHEIIRKWEKYLIGKSAFSIMVNDSIADEVQRIYKLKTRPIVVRSTPSHWDIDKVQAEKMRLSFLDKFKKRRQKGNSAMESAFLVMYHGGIMRGRGIEVLLQLTKINPFIHAIILGNGDAGYLDSLKEMAKEFKIDERVLFHPAVPLEELWKYVGAVDLSLMMISGKAKSYYYALPNKFFESIQALTPIVASSFPEMKRLIDKYEIGLTCDPEDIRAVNECVEKMRTDREFYKKCKENLQVAKAELCWENEKRVLEEAIRKIT